MAHQLNSIPRSLSPTPLNVQPQHLHPTDHNLKGAGRVTATAVRTPEPRFRKADVSGRSDVPEQIPGRQDSENANSVTSTMSISDFHKTRPTLFWATKGEKKEIKAEEKIKFPDIFPLMWRDTVTKRGEAKAVVQAAACINQEGVEEYLAVKVVSFDSDEARDRADEEVKTLKNLRHNHIIAFVGCYTSGDTLGILLFPLAKYNLWTYMKTISKHNQAQHSGIITPHKYVSRLRGYFACLCQALLYLHDRENPIKHRDIKPENILIDAFGTVILTDFDISKEYRTREAAVTSGNTMCTVKYASKETFSGINRDLDSDIFSLGCVFLEMVTVILGESFMNLYAHVSGKKPDNIQTPDNIYVVYCEKSAEVNSWVEKLRAVVKKGTKDAVAPVSRCKALDEKSLDMILKMMSESPAERPGLRQVIEEFEQLREQCVNCHPVEPTSRSEFSSTLEQTEAQVQDSRLGITTQERTTKPAPVNLLTSSQLETVPESEYNLPETKPPNGDIFLAKDRIGSGAASSSRKTGIDISGKGIDAIREQKTRVAQTPPHSVNNTPPPPASNQFAGSNAHDAVVGDRPPTQMPTSNPRTSSATIPESIPMSRNFSEVSTATRDSNRISRLNFQESPRTTHNFTTPKPDFQTSPRSTHNFITSKPPSSTLDLDPNVAVPPRNPSVNQGLSDIRIYSAQRKDKGIRIIPKIEDIPGKHVIVYNPDTYEYAVMKKHDINYKEGILMFLPHGDGWKYRTLTGDVNLWKSLRFKVNLKRCFGMIRVMFLKGSYPSNMLLKETLPVG